MDQFTVKFERWNKVFTLFLKSAAGATLILFLALFCQIPGISMYISNIMIQRSNGSINELLGIAIGIGFALMFDFIIYFFSIRCWNGTAYTLAILSALVSLSSYHDLLHFEALPEQWDLMLAISHTIQRLSIIIMAVVPAWIIATLSHKIAKHENTSQQKAILDKMEQKNMELVAKSLKAQMKKLGKSKKAFADDDQPEFTITNNLSETLKAV